MFDGDYGPLRSRYKQVYIPFPQISHVSAMISDVTYEPHAIPSSKIHTRERQIAFHREPVIAANSHAICYSLIGLT